MKSANKFRVKAIAFAVSVALSPAVWADTQDDIEQLKQQVEELTQKLQALEQQQEIDKENAAKAAEAANKLAQKPSSVSSGSGVKIKLGGYIDATTVYRSANEVTDLTSQWNAKGYNVTGGNGIPYANTPQGQTPEYGETARGSRISLLATGNPNDKTALGAYIESDFLGAAQTANSQQTNSYTPRLRQGYATYDESDWGIHFLAGQAWSLATQFKDGLTPRDENIPITIDSGYIPGFNYTRNPQFRLVKDFNQTFWLGVSLESPQALVGGTAPGYLNSAAAYNNAKNAAVGTALTSYANTYNGYSVPVVGETGTSNFNNANTYSTDSKPDIIVKGAVDPGWGHYELYGLYRWFTDRTTDLGLGPLATSTTGSGTNTTTTGEGIGGSVLLPAIPKILDLQASFLTGHGIGRYGATQLPDVTYNLNGTLATIPETDFLFGATLHPAPDWDVFSYFGKEFASQTAFQSGTPGLPFTYGAPSATNAPTLFSGYGIPIVQNAGCSVNPTITPSATNCEAVTAASQQWTIGTYWRFYRGTYGTLQWGASFSHTTISSFAGFGGAPNPDLNVYLVSFRYYPFQ